MSFGINGFDTVEVTAYTKGFRKFRNGFIP